MADDHNLLDAAGRISDGELIDWLSITATCHSDEDRAIAEELAVVQQIAAGHRQLHQLLPVAPNTPPHLMPDRARWGHLDLLNVVGRGSYGMVYRAWDTRLERLVALKLFHGAANPDAVMQEGRMLARVRHENVVTVYGADVIDGVAGIWMELVHGETLDSIVKKSGPLPAREAAAVGADVARALGAVHAAALLHCDVKAQNVVREASGRVVLMDLGAGRLAPEASDGDQLSDVAGTPRYMAPELFAAGTTATRASDIYSLGVLIYYLVSGKFPVDGKTLGELKRAHEARKVRPLGSICPDLPKPFLEVVTRAIDRDSALRPLAAADVQIALSSVAIEPDAPPAHRSRAAGWWFAAVVAVVGLAVALLAPLLKRPAVAEPGIQSVAVLPIKNLTGDPSKQYLADGLTEVIVAHLARLPGLHVASSAAMATLRESGDDEKALAAKLGVRLLLAGSVVQADSRIALSMKLVDPREGRTIWGSEIERQPSNILGARSEIAGLVAARLSLLVPAGIGDETRPPLRAEAQDAFLRALAELRPGSDATHQHAVELLSQVVALEPAWADPLAHLAFAQQMVIEFGNPFKRSQGSDVVRANALKAMQLDPSVSMAYTALAAVQAYHDWDFPGAEATLRQAIAADPHDGTARGRLAFLLAARGRLQEAIQEATAARDQEPLIPDRHGVLSMVQYYARDWDAAIAGADRALALAPQFANAHLVKGLVLGASGKPAEGIASIRRALAIAENPGWLAWLGVTCARAGDTTCVVEVKARLRALEGSGAFVSVDNYAYIAGYEHRLDDAFRFLNEAVDRRMTNVLWLAVDPRADALRSDPRFDRVVARMGLVSR